MSRKHRSAILGLAVATLASVSVVPAGPAWATGPQLSRSRTVVRPAEPAVPSGNADERHQRRRVPRIAAPGSELNFGPSYPFGYNYTGPSYPFGRNYTGPTYPSRNYTGPTYPSRSQYVAPGRAAPVLAVPPPSPRWVHGYWAQQWVPQYYTYDAWIPGYFARNGGWVQGHYESQTAESGGYYQRMWVEGYWAE